MKLFYILITIGLLLFGLDLYLMATLPDCKEYQLTLSPDSITVYDGTRVIGTAAYDSTLVNLLLNDNR